MRRQELKMPYKSQAQAGYFHTHPELSKLVPEWDKATKGMSLPRRASQRKPESKTPRKRLPKLQKPKVP
jgi:hypothetical protein